MWREASTSCWARAPTDPTPSRPQSPPQNRPPGGPPGRDRLMRDAIVVTGLGLVTPGGIGREATWQAVCAGRSVAGLDPELDGLPVPPSCRVPGFDAHEL